MLIENFNNLEDPEFEPIKDDFLIYLNERIHISTDSNETIFQVNLNDMASIFRKKAGHFLNKRKLIDYSIDNIKILITTENIKLDAHFIKYHLITPFNGLMQVAQLFQNTIEDSTAGSRIGTALKENFNNLPSKFLNETNYSDSLRIGLEYAKIKLYGSKNQVSEATDEELELGLE